MQDPLTSSFRWGETFDTAPLSNIDTSPCRDARSERPLYQSETSNDDTSNPM